MVWIPPGYELAAEAPVQQQRESHLWDYIWLIWRGRWIVILSFLICTGIATQRMLKAVPVYSAHAKLQVGAQTPNVMSMGEEVAPMSRNFVSTQMAVLKSRTLARQIVEEYNLYAPAQPVQSSEAPGATKAKVKEPSIFRSSLSSFKSYVMSFVSKPKTRVLSKDPKDVAERIMSARVSMFQNSLSVMGMEGSDVVSIGYIGLDPVECARIANAVCDAYRRWSYQTHTNSYDYASKWLDQKLSDVKAALEKSEETLLEFAGGKDIFALADNIENISANLEGTAQGLEAAKRELSDMQFQLASIKNGIQPAVPMDDTRLRELSVELAKQEIEYAAALEKWGPALPEVKIINATISGLKKLISDETDRIKSESTKSKDMTLAKAQFEYDRANSQSEYLRKSYEEQKERFLGIQQRLVKYNILKREVDVNKEMYNSLLIRSREIGLTSTLNAGNVLVVERAEVPLAPLPNKQTVLLGAFLGIFIGVGLIFFREYMNTTVRGALDIKKDTQMATLGLFPHHATHRSAKGEKIHPEQITAKEPRSSFAENVRQLRTALQYSMAGRAPKSIMVTSALPGEGKTTVASNLAISLAQSGRRTILIDADLKKPSIHEFFNVDRNKGLTDILTGKTHGKLNGHVVQADTENLFVLPSGERPPNPVDLLDSNAMRRLLSTLSEHFDHIIVDSTPTLDLSDTGVLFPYVDGVVVVVKPGKTPRAAVVKVNEKILGLGGRVLGAVLNNRKPRSGKRSRYGSGYGYGGYGEDIEVKTEKPLA